MIATTRSTPRWAKIMTTSPRCMPLCTRWWDNIEVASNMCLYVNLRSGVLPVAVSTTHGRSGCWRALLANISWIGPLKSDQCRSAVGSGISPLVREAIVACNGSQRAEGDVLRGGCDCARVVNDSEMAQLMRCLMDGKMGTTDSRSSSLYKT